MRSKNEVVLSLLPVNCQLMRGFLYAGSTGEFSRRTWAHSAPNSSAITAGKVVAIPCPISACDTTKVTELSGSIRTQALSGVPEAPAGWAEATSNVHPSANALPAADTDDRKERLVSAISNERFCMVFTPDMVDLPIPNPLRVAQNAPARAAAANAPDPGSRPRL